MPSAKFDVDISSFKNGIASAKNEVKTLDQQMKLIDATFKTTGNSEQALANKTQTLNSRMAAQKNMAAQAEAALKAMTEAGVDPASEAYQRMAREMLMAQTGMQETQLAMNELGNGAVTAAGGVNQLETGLKGISKKISLDQVISGINKITNGLENAAKKAISLGKEIWNNIVDVARFSDDTATSAMMLNMNVEDYQAYKKVFDTVGEITVQEWQKAKSKVQKAVVDTSDEQFNIFAALGIGLRDVNGNISPYYNKYVIGAARDWEDVFWDIGKALREKVASKELSQDQADVYAQAIFGGKWSQYNSIFDMGREEFQRQVDEQITATEEAIQKNAKLNDTLVDLQGDFQSLKVEVLSGLAPALTTAADSLDNLLAQVMEYLKTPEGQKALKDLETSVSGLFEDLGKIDPEQVVSGFTGVFNTVIGSVQWLVDNKDSVISAMKGIVIGWGTLEVTGGILEVVKIVSGIKSLAGAEAAGTAAGKAWGAGFAAAVAKAAPWLISIYTLLNPSGTSDQLGNNTLVDENGNVTAEGKSVGLRQDEKGNIIEDRAQIINEAAQKAWDLYRTNQLTQAGMEDLRRVVMNDDKFQSLMQEFMSFRNQNGDSWMSIEDIDLTSWLNDKEPPKVIIQPEAPADSAADIAAQIGTVTVYVEPIVGDLVNNTEKRRRNNGIPGYANGITYVPDTRLAWLHPGETVTPAREVGARTFNSNMYFQNVVMNNGQDADGMAARIVAAQRREISGFGG